jgi:hypothetical protein
LSIQCLITNGIIHNVIINYMPTDVVVAVTTITIVTKMATPQQQEDQAIHPWHHY